LAAEKTLDTLGTGVLRNAFEKVPFEQRITHSGTHGFPDATLSDHLPVTCDVTIQ